MKRDFWDKLGIIGTFLSSTIIVAFSSIVTCSTNRLSNKIEEFKTSMDENKMINELVKEISNDSSSTIRGDFTLLALERYLLNSGKDTVLKLQDRNMLVGFAQSLILDRENNFENDLNMILIPQEFLARYDSARLKLVNNILAKKSKKTILPAENLAINDSNLRETEPISQISDATQSKMMSIILKKVAYIQYSNLEKQNEIKTIQKKLVDNKWIAPGIEYVKGNYSNTIKYFHDEDSEIAYEANKILDNKFDVIPITSSKMKKLAPKGQIEIWVSGL